LVGLSFAVNYFLHGFDVYGYHVVNLAIHILAGLTLFGVVRRTLRHGRGIPEAAVRRSTVFAGVVALIWLLHPLQTEAVTYVVQRAESGMGLLYLLTLYCFARGTVSTGAKWWYAGAVAACAAGMGTKEVMVTAPIMVLLNDLAKRFAADGAFMRDLRQRGAFLPPACWRRLRWNRRVSAWPA
jgi:hypothetical protein